MTSAAEPGPGGGVPADGARVPTTLCELLGLSLPEMTRLVSRLADRGHTLATAESLTAGLVTAAVTEIPGSSAVLRGGVVCYATDLKSSLVGVDRDLLDTTGPVAAEVANRLASGIRLRCGATIGVGLTGVAGPGSQDGHPPGTFYVAVSSPWYDEVRGWGPPPPAAGRWQVRSAAVRAALDMVNRALDADGNNGAASGVSRLHG